MKAYSVNRRVVWLVLAVELIAAIGVVGFAFVYERHAHFESFDIGLRGRADSVMGAVEDADDAKLGVMLDKTDLKMPRHDVYAVREEGGQELGRSLNWSPAAENWLGEPGYFTLTIRGHSYRGIRLHGVRVVDPMSANVRHPLTVLYASPTGEVWEDVLGAVQVFALANGLLVLVTALLVPGIVRRSMRPLHLLAIEAGGVTASRWTFAPKDEVRQVEELRPLVEALEAVIRRLERSFTQQKQFVGDAAHELKTAVAVVKSSIQLLDMKTRTAEEYEAGLKRCHADCLRMEDLAQKMLLLARVEDGNGAYASSEDERTNLAEGIAGAMAELEPVAALRRVSLVSGGSVMEGQGTSGWIGLRAETLRSLLVNLLTNAVQHSADGSLVKVFVERDGAMTTLVVEDSGEGIDPEALPFVFGRFYRGDPSRSRKTGGTGLGLAICKAIVDQAGGEIAIQSVLQQGTRVVVRLPVLGPWDDETVRGFVDPFTSSSASLQESRRH